MEQYELMKLLFIDGQGSHSVTDPNAKYPNGVDSEPCMVGSARGIIQYLLKTEPALQNYKLTKKTTKAKG